MYAQKTLHAWMTPLATLLALVVLWPTAARAQADIECGEADQTQTATKFSLYYEDYKIKSYETALPNLLWILECKPGFPNNNDFNFDKAVKVYEGLALATEDADQQRAWMDSALVIFDTAVPRLMAAGVQVDSVGWLFDKARFMQKHGAILVELQPEVGPMYRRVYDHRSGEMQAYYVDYIFADHFEKDEKEQIVEFAEAVRAVHSENEEIMAIVYRWEEITFKSPEERIEFLEGKMERDPGNVETMTELFELYIDEEYRDRAYELAPALLEASPSARVYRLVGQMRMEDGEAEAAYQMFEEAMALPGAEDYARDLEYNMGAAQQQMGRLSRARTHYRNAIERDPNYGRAYLAIGDLYAAAISNCSTFERDDRAVYWLVTDYYARAKARDESVAAAADRKTRQYVAYYPTAEEKFLMKIETGDRFTVNQGQCYGWINETTTVK